MLLLNFRVNPDWLKANTRVPKKVELIFTGHNKEELLKIIPLGESGIRMSLQGAPFECVPRLAKKLIKSGVAIRARRTPLDLDHPDGLFKDYLLHG